MHRWTSIISGPARIAALPLLLLALAMGGCSSPKSAGAGKKTANGDSTQRMSLNIPSPSPLRLPMSTVFKGESKFQRLVSRAKRENWRALPIGERTTRVGRALLGTPYKNFTLEIHDRIEAPSVNFYGMDCWTFYEISLAFARMLRLHPDSYTPRALLHMVEVERYRNGRCTGSYLSRMHHLEEVFYDNRRRGLAYNPTRSLGGVRIRRNINEMQSAWRLYRYLRNSPKLRRGIADVERRVSRLPVYYIPKSRVAGIEKSLRNGDIIAIASTDSSGYTSHVGLALRSGSTTRFMHATSSRSKGRKVIVDSRISSYLRASRSRAGIIVCRPFDLPVSGGQTAEAGSLEGQAPALTLGSRWHHTPFAVIGDDDPPELAL